VKDLRGQLQAADGVLICTPEYAYGMPGALKNALDWTVSTGEFYDKPIATISASPSSTGGEKAHASLLLTLTALAAEIVEGGTLIIPFVRTKLNAAGDVSDPETALALRSVLDALARVVLIAGASISLTRVMPRTFSRYVCMSPRAVPCHSRVLGLEFPPA